MTEKPAFLASEAGVETSPEKEEDSILTANDEPDTFDEIIVRIKRDISQHTRKGRADGTSGPSAMDKTTPKSPSKVFVHHVAGGRSNPSSLNTCEASGASSASASTGKRGIQTKIRSATVNLPTWRHFSSRDRTFWECKTPFVFTGRAKKRSKIKPIEEECEADVTEEEKHVTKGKLSLTSFLTSVDCGFGWYSLCIYISFV